VPAPATPMPAPAPVAHVAVPAVAAAPTTPVAVSMPAPVRVPAAAAIPTSSPPRQQAVAPVVAPAQRADTDKSDRVAAAMLELSGRVDLVGGRGQQVEAGEQVDTLVYFVPDAGAPRTKPGHYTIYTHNRDFSPEAMALPEGSTVTFVNLDDVRHNVFSVTPGSSFDLGYQGAGEKADHVFRRAGIVLVSCHVHRSMELDLLVVPTPYFAKVAADGSFTLHGLPAGAGTLHFWNPRAQPLSKKVRLPMAAAVSGKLVAIKPRMITELNAGARP
jgi:plastocyanin